MAEIEAARQTFLAVFARARRCTEAGCRRRKICLAGWRRGRDNMLYHKTGGCPVMTEAEWEIIQLGIFRNRDLVLTHLQAIWASKPPKAEKLSPAEWRRRSEEERKRQLEAPATSFAQFLWTWPTETGAAWPRLLEPKIRPKR